MIYNIMHYDIIDFEQNKSLYIDRCVITKSALVLLMCGIFISVYSYCCE